MTGEPGLCRRFRRQIMLRSEYDQYPCNSWNSHNVRNCWRAGKVKRFSEYACQWAQQEKFQ